MAWSFVQSCVGFGGSGNAVATFTTANLSSGTKLIAYVSQDVGSTGTITSVKDGAGNTFTQCALVNYPSTSGTLAVYAMDTPAGDVGTKPTITATLTSTFGWNIVVEEVSGLATGNTTAAMLDGTAATTTGTASPATGGAYSSTAANEFLVAVVGDPGFSATYTETGYTPDANNPAPNGFAGLQIGYKNSANGSESMSWAINMATTWATVLVAFQLPGGGGTNAPAGVASATAGVPFTAVTPWTEPAIISLGTPVNTHTTTSSSAAPGTSAWGTGQNRTTGNLLLAVMSSAASTSVAATAEASGTTGWTNLIEEGNSATAHARTAIWWKVASGGDAPPSFFSTSAGTAGGMNIMLFELEWANTTSPLATSGVFASGSSTTTLTSTLFTATTTAAPVAAGEYGISSFVQERAAANLTFTDSGTGWTKLLNGTGVSSVLQSYTGVQANPSTGSTLNDHGQFSTDTTAFGAALVAVFAEAAYTFPAAGQPAATAAALNATVSTSGGGTNAPAGLAQATAAAVSAAAAVAPAGGLAQATAAALNAAVTVTAAGGVAQAAATARAPAVTVAAAAGLAQAAAASLAPAVTVAATAGLAQATAAGLAPASAVIVAAGLAQSAAAALNATASTSGTVTAPAGLAAATAAAVNTAVTVSPAAGPAQSAAAAQTPAVQVSPSAGAPTAASSAFAPAVTVSPAAGAAQATAAALNATVTTSGGTSAPAGLATATATALTPGVTVAVSAGVATATASARAPAATVSPAAGLASATATARSVASITVAAVAGRALADAVALTVLFGGAPLSDQLLGGVISFVPYGGSVAFQPYTGNITFTPYAGSISFQPYGGTLTGGSVATQQDVSPPNAAIVNNDTYLYLTILYNGSPLNLTGYTLKAVLKATRLTPDSEGITFTTSSGLTVTSVPGGLVTWVVPHGDLTEPGNQWYRVDVIDASSEVFTSLYGNFTVQPA